MWPSLENSNELDSTAAVLQLLFVSVTVPHSSSGHLSSLPLMCCVYQVILLEANSTNKKNNNFLLQCMFSFSLFKCLMAIVHKMHSIFSFFFTGYLLVRGKCSRCEYLQLVTSPRLNTMSEQIYKLDMSHHNDYIAFGSSMPVLIFLMYYK